MKIAARILLGLVALMLLYNGVLYMFAPEIQLSSTMVEPTGDGIFGMSNIRANIGAPMVTFGILYLIGAITMNPAAIRPVIIFAGIAIIARIAGIISMGIDPEFLSVRIIVVLVVFLVVGLFGNQVFKNSDA